MGWKLDFIANDVVGHVVLYDNAPIAAALAGATEAGCDVLTFHGPGPDRVRFCNPMLPSPQGDQWWSFKRLGDRLPETVPAPPRSIKPPYWQFENWGGSNMVPPQGITGRRRVGM